MFKELFEKTDKALDAQDVSKVLVRFKEFKAKGHGDSEAAMAALALGTELTQKRKGKVKEKAEYVISDLGTSDVEVKDEQGKVVAKVDRYGVWKWNPTKDRHEIVKSGSDLDALKKAYPNAEVVKTPVQWKTTEQAFGDPYAGYTPPPEDVVTDYYGEQIYEEDVVELAPSSKYYEDYKGLKFQITTLEREGDRWRAYLQEVGEPENSLTTWADQVMKVE